jgi:hypothetical protein
MPKPRPIPTNQYEEFRYRLFDESPRAAYWFESMVFGIMAQTGVDETAALELVCRILIHPAQIAAKV